SEVAARKVPKAVQLNATSLVPIGKVDRVMFGRKQSEENLVVLPVRTAAPSARPASNPNQVPNTHQASGRRSARPAAPVEEPYEIKSNEYYNIKQQLFNALIEIVDVVQIAKLEPAKARNEVRDVVNEILVAKKVPMSLAERQDLIEDICNDVLGYG